MKHQRGNLPRLKFVEDLTLSFHRYRILKTWWTLVPTLSSITVFFRPWFSPNIRTRHRTNFYPKESCRRLLFDSYQNFMSRGNILQTFSRKTLCFHPPSSLWNETTKQPSFWLKFLEDLKLLFDWYQILVPRWTWLSTISSVKVSMHLLSKL